MDVNTVIQILFISLIGGIGFLSKSAFNKVIDKLDNLDKDFHKMELLLNVMRNDNDRILADIKLLLNFKDKYIYTLEWLRENKTELKSLINTNHHGHE